jgi:type II secretory pathway pseudopilin PulG
MGRQDNTEGHTLIEATIVLAISAFLITIVANLVTSAGDSQAYSQRMARATEVHQEIVNDIRGDLLSAVSLFENGSRGSAYWNSLEFPKAAQPLASTKLPTAVLLGTFKRELATGARTGNSLLFANQAWTTEFGAGSGKRYRIDVYRITCFYLAKAGDGPSARVPDGLTLAKFVSEPLADGDQFDAIADPADRTEVLLHLLRRTPDVEGNKHPSARLLWKRGREIGESGAIREIDPISSTLSMIPVPPRAPGAWKIHIDETRSNRDLLEFRKFAIATNHAGKRFGVARFGKKDKGGDGFPHGFEIQMRGPSSTRQVMVHSSIVGTNRKGTRAHSDLRATVTVQDM